MTDLDQGDWQRLVDEVIDLGDLLERHQGSAEQRLLLDRLTSLRQEIAAEQLPTPDQAVQALGLIRKAYLTKRHLRQAKA